MSKNFTLVTGAAGFIGSSLTRELLIRGRSVVALDCFLPNLYPAEVKRSRWNRLDGRNLVKIEFDMRFDDFSILREYNIDSVFNEAAMPGLNQNWSQFAPYYDCNLSALNRLLEYTKSLQINSFVQASTSSVYGLVANGNEDQKLEPMSPYGVSKLAAEKLLTSYYKWFGLPVKILRYFSVYGPNQRPDMAFAKIIDAIVSGKEFVIHGDGEQKRSNTFINDVVSATLLSESLAPAGSIINVCGQETITLNQAIEHIEFFAGAKLKKSRGPARIGDQIQTSESNQLAMKILGWKAQTNFEEGLRQQVVEHVSRKL